MMMMSWIIMDLCWIYVVIDDTAAADDDNDDDDDDNDVVAADDDNAVVAVAVAAASIQHSRISSTVASDAEDDEPYVLGCAV